MQLSHRLLFHYRLGQHSLIQHTITTQLLLLIISIPLTKTRNTHRNKINKTTHPNHRISNQTDSHPQKNQRKLSTTRERITTVFKELDGHYRANHYHSNRYSDRNSDKKEQDKPDSKQDYLASTPIVTWSELQSRASKRIKSVIMYTWILSSTQPTPLIVAHRTGHMITPWHFLDPLVTFLAFLNSRSILPIFYLFLKSTFTTGVRMSFPITTTADKSTTLRTFVRFVLRIRL